MSNLPTLSHGAKVPASDDREEPRVLGLLQPFVVLCTTCLHPSVAAAHPQSASSTLRSAICITSDGLTHARARWSLWTAVAGTRLWPPESQRRIRAVSPDVDGPDVDSMWPIRPDFAISGVHLNDPSSINVVLLSGLSMRAGRRRPDVDRVRCSLPG